jgi:GTP-binding protein
MLDIAPFDDSDPVDNANIILGELEKYSPAMLDEPRWLVLNKTDLLTPEEAEYRCRDIIERLNWTGPVYEISAISATGTRELVFDIMMYLEENADAT